MEKGKMVKTAKALDTVFKILIVLIRIGIIACVAVPGIFTVVYFIHPELLTVTAFDLLEIGPLTLKLAEGVTLSNHALLLYVWITVAAAAAPIAVVYYALHVIRKILAPMTQGNPFHPAVGKEIRKLAFASLAIGIIQNIVIAVETYHTLHTFNLNALLQNSQIQSITASFDFDLSAVVVFFVLLLMSYIFQYGEELQKLSDETL